MNAPPSHQPSPLTLDDHGIFACRSAAELHGLQIMGKEDVVRELNNYLAVLHNKCALCWAFLDIKTGFHKKYVQDCQAAWPKRRYITWGYGWIEWKRKCLKLSGGGFYCYGCYLPAGQFTPQYHRNVPYVKETHRCGFSDLVVMTCWVLYHAPELWKKTQDAFGFGSKTLIQWGEWLMAIPNTASFNNMVTVFIWFCRERNVA